MAEHLRTKTKALVAWPYLVDSSGDFFAWPYVIMPRLRGLQLSDPAVNAQLSKQDRLELAAAMGINLAHMHRFQQPYPGIYDPVTEKVRPLRTTYIAPWLQTPDNWNDPNDTPLSTEEVYQRWISSRIDFFLNQALQTSDPTTGRTTPPEDAEWIAAMLDNAKAALQVPFQACFVMNDYKEGNTVAEKIDGRWQVTGVFDLMEGYFGDGEADLSRSLAAYGIADKHNDERAYIFLDAYFRTREEQPVRPGFTQRFVVYMLMDRLIMWMGGRALGGFDAFTNFRSYCEPYLTLNNAKLSVNLLR